jgi:WD40 repeat protein
MFIHRFSKACPQLVHAQVWHPQSGLVAGVCGCDDVTLWEVPSGKVIATIDGTRDARSLAFSPSGEHLAVGLMGIIKIFPVSPLGVPAQDPAHLFCPDAGYAYALAWSPDGASLAFAGKGEGLFIWKPFGGKTQRAFLSSVLGDLTQVSWSSDGTHMAWRKRGVDAIQVGNALTGKRTRLFFGHRRSVQGFAWEPSSQQIASCAAGYDDQTVQVWDVTNGSVCLMYREHTEGVLAVTYSPDGTSIASCDLHGQVRVWDARSGETVYLMQRDSSCVTSVAWSPDGMWLALADTQCSILILPIEHLLLDETAQKERLSRGK